MSAPDQHQPKMSAPDQHQPETDVDDQEKLVCEFVESNFRGSDDTSTMLYHFFSAVATGVANGYNLRMDQVRDIFDQVYNDITN